MTEENLRRQGVISNTPFTGSHNWNNMQDIQLALNYPIESEFMSQWLDWWGSLSKDDTKIYRTMNLEEIGNFGLPIPPSPINSTGD